MSQSEELASIDHYMRSTPLQNPQSFKIKDAYFAFYDPAGLWDKNLSTDFLNRARSYKKQLEDSEAVFRAQGSGTQKVATPGLRPGEYAILTDAEVKKLSPSVSTPIAPTSTVAGKTFATIRQGSTGEAVRVWQAIIGVPVDGNFGPATASATKAWQSSRGLTADGIVGPNTWGAAGAATSTPAFAPTIAPTPTFKPQVTQPQPTFKDVQAEPSRPISTAGMFDFTSWPTWAQVAAVGTLVAGGISLMLGKKPLRIPGLTR